MEINERQMVRHYKREHYTREVIRALKRFKGWTKDGDIKPALIKVNQSYGDLIHAQVIYQLNQKLNQYE